MKTISDRVSDVAKAMQDSDDELKQLQSQLQENVLRADQKSQKSFTLMAVLSAFWILLRLSTVNKISVLGLEIEDIPLLLSVLPCLVAFSYYRFMCTEGLVALIDDALRSLHKRHLPLSYREDLTELLTVPTIQHIEASLENMESPGTFFRKLSGPWMTLIVLVLVFTPLGLLTWMTVVTVRLNQAPVSIRIIEPLIVGLFAFRSMSLWIQWIRQL